VTTLVSEEQNHSMQAVEHRRHARERTVAPISKPQQSLRWEPRPTPDCGILCRIGLISLCHRAPVIQYLIHQATYVTSLLWLRPCLCLWVTVLPTARSFRHAFRCSLFQCLEDTADDYEYSGDVRYKWWPLDHQPCQTKFHPCAFISPMITC
jgi:hypothetical protein